MSAENTRKRSHRRLSRSTAFQNHQRLSLIPPIIIVIRRPRNLSTPESSTSILVPPHFSLSLLLPASRTCHLSTVEFHLPRRLIHIYIYMCVYYIHTYVHTNVVPWKMSVTTARISLMQPCYRQWPSVEGTTTMRGGTRLAIEAPTTTTRTYTPAHTPLRILRIYREKRGEERRGVEEKGGSKGREGPS